MTNAYEVVMMNEDLEKAKKRKRRKWKIETIKYACMKRSKYVCCQREELSRSS